MVTCELTELFEAECGGGIGGSRRLIKLEPGKPVKSLGWESRKDTGRGGIIRKQKQGLHIK